MTKQEAIEKAYGEYWNEAKKNVNENGWFNKQNLKYKDCLFLFGKDSVLFEKYANDFYRPKSLQGIEYNNGWIKIESENDLPKEEDDIFVMIDNSIHLYSEVISLRCLTETLGGHITHYQPVIKPKPPIY